LVSFQRAEFGFLLETLPEAPLRTEELQVTFLRQCFGSNSLKDQPCSEVVGGTELAAAVLAYFDHLQVNMAQFTTIRPLCEADTMTLDEIACRDLELFESARRRQLSGSLFKEINC